MLVVALGMTSCSQGSAQIAQTAPTPTPAECPNVTAVVIRKIPAFLTGRGVDSLWVGQQVGQNMAIIKDLVAV